MTNVSPPLLHPTGMHCATFERLWDERDLNEKGFWSAP